MIKDLQQTDKLYYLVIGEQYLYDRARQMNLKATYLSEDYPDEKMINLAKKAGKSILFLIYDTTDKNEFDLFTPSRINDLDSKIVVYNIYGVEVEEGHIISLSSGQIKPA